MADPDIELRGGGGGFFSLALPAFLPSAIFFSPKIRGARAVTRIHFYIISTLILPTLGYRENFKNAHLKELFCRIE